MSKRGFSISRPLRALGDQTCVRWVRNERSADQRIKDKVVSFRLTREGHDALRLMAHAEQRSVNSLIVEAINQARKRKGLEPVW